MTNNSDTITISPTRQSILIPFLEMLYVFYFESSWKLRWFVYLIIFLFTLVLAIVSELQFGLPAELVTYGAIFLVGLFMLLVPILFSRRESSL